MIDGDKVVVGLVDSAEFDSVGHRVKRRPAVIKRHRIFSIVGASIVPIQKLWSRREQTA
jgi:hypothetical protein